MKITNSALLFAAAIGAVSAKDTPLRRARSLQDVDAADAIEADGRRSGSGSSFDGDLGTVTSLKGECVYDFDDEDHFQVLSGSPAAMTCVGNRCNPELGVNTVVGVEFEEIKDEKKLVGYFNVNCPSKITEFGISCPSGYNVEKVIGISINKPLFDLIDCSNSPKDDNVFQFSGNYCILKQLSLFDTQTKFKYFCVENDDFININWD